jgi:hypothetical protein
VDRRIFSSRMPFLLVAVLCSCQHASLALPGNTLDGLLSQSKEERLLSLSALRGDREAALPMLEAAISDPRLANVARDLLDEFTPMGTLRAIESTLIESEGTFVRFSSANNQVVNADLPLYSGYSGSLLLETAQLLLFHLAGEGNPKAWGISANADRAWVRVGVDGQWVRVWRPSNLRTRLAKMFVRLGALVSLTKCISDLRSGPGNHQYDGPPVFELSHGPTNENLRSLSYRIQVDQETFAHFILYYDPVSYQLQSRTWSWPKAQGQGNERYDTFHFKR